MIVLLLGPPTAADAPRYCWAGNAGENFVDGFACGAP